MAQQKKINDLEFPWNFKFFKTPSQKLLSVFERGTRGIVKFDSI
jgi:hypothetical protein